VAIPNSGLLMTDPSFLLSASGFTWVQDQAVRRSIAVPAAFGEWLTGQRDLDIEPLIAPDDLEAVGDRRPRLVETLADFTLFSYADAGSQLPREVQTVLRNLLESEDGLGRLYADEWAFLQSQSNLLSKIRHPIDAFRDAGAAVVEVGRRTRDVLVTKVIKPEHVPPVLTPGLVGKVAAKWLIVGGAAVGGGTLGGVLGTLAGGPVGGVLGGKAGGWGAGALSGAAVLAIDP
jgi:hypothetical protein